MSSNDETKPASDRGRGLRSEADPTGDLTEAVPDDTVVLGDDAGDGAHGPSLNDRSKTGELGPGLEPARRAGRKDAGQTEAIPTRTTAHLSADDIAGSTENVGRGASGGGDFINPDDAEEVLVLLEEEGDLGTGGDDGDRFTDEVGLSTAALSTQSIEDIPLRKSNPLGGGSRRGDPTDEIDDTEFEDGSTENIGVINEIAELATSLDPEILAAGSGDEAPSIDDEEAAPTSYRGASDFSGGVPSGRSRRSGVLVTLTALAACAAAGVYFWPELQSLYQQYVVGDRNAVAASSGVTRVDTPTGSPTTTTPATGVIDVDPAESGPDARLSATRKAVRDKVFLAMRLGTQWVEGKE